MIYASDDANRVSRTLRLLAEYDISQWALTGGTAIELYLRGVRPLHDLDFVAASFDSLPSGLGKAILIRHAHPHDPPAKTMLQAVDPATSVRVDVFRAYGAEMERARTVVDVARSTSIEPVWQEHRQVGDPESFAEAAGLLRTAIATRSDLLVQPVYSTDVDEVCVRCESTASFPLADARHVFALLGYC